MYIKSTDSTVMPTEVALEFIATMTPQGGSRYRRLDPEVLVQRDEMANRLRLLKGRKEAV